MAALSFAVWFNKLNIDISFDPSHGVHNDMLNAVKFAGLKSHLHMTLLRLNVPHGPWDEDLRYKQVCGSISEMLSTGSPKNHPLFMNRLDDMLEDPACIDIRGKVDPATAL